MDLSKTIFSDSTCTQDGSSQNPLMTAMNSLLSGPEMAHLDSHFDNIQDHFQDAWEQNEADQKMPELQPHENLEEAWQETTMQQAWHDPTYWKTNFANPTPEALEEFVRW